MTNVASDYHSSDTFEKAKKKSNEDMKTGTFPKKVGIVFVEASDAKKH
jgi:hypothetical protein